MSRFVLLSILTIALLHSAVYAADMVEAVKEVNEAQKAKKLKEVKVAAVSLGIDAKFQTVLSNNTDGDIKILCRTDGNKAPMYTYDYFAQTDWLVPLAVSCCYAPGSVVDVTVKPGKTLTFTAVEPAKRGSKARMSLPYTDASNKTQTVKSNDIVIVIEEGE